MQKKTIDYVLSLGVFSKEDDIESLIKDYSPKTKIYLRRLSKTAQEIKNTPKGEIKGKSIQSFLDEL